MPGGPLDEVRLARAAAAGDGQAFARLYDAYEGRIYTFCFRLVGNEQDAQDAMQDAFLKVLQRLPSLQDRELNFGAYLFTAARNASYDVIGRRKKADAVDEIPEAGARPVYGDASPLDLDPERTAMLGSLQESVRGANERLPERQREVLALRELEELSYDEIAEIMDMNRNSVAQLISRARIKLRDELRGSALASVATSSADCERALPLISMRQDGQLKSDEDRAWLAAHIDGCDTCKVSVDAMEEAGISYRAWTPVVPAAFLFRETMAKAAELTGSDWTAIGRPGSDGGGDAGSADDGGAAPGGGSSGGTTTVLAGVGAAATEVVEEDGRRRRGLFAALLAAVLLIGGGSVALVVGSDDPPETIAEEPVAAVVTGTPTPTPTPAAGGRPATATPRSGSKSRRRETTPALPTRPVEVVIGPGLTQTIQVPVAPTVPTRPTRPGRPTKRPVSGTVDATGGGGSGGQSGSGRDPLKGTPTPTPGGTSNPDPTPPRDPAPDPGPASDPTPPSTSDPSPEPTPAPTRDPSPEPTPQPTPAPTPTACRPSTLGCDSTGPSGGGGCRPGASCRRSGTPDATGAGTTTTTTRRIP
jgi:RNA polymerase sigma factor (sigma-70 family)